MYPINNFSFCLYKMAESLLEEQNVNGVKLRLKVDNIQNSPIARRFTITFTKNDFKSSLQSIFAVIFCVIALFYYNINIKVLLVMIAVILVLIGLWVTFNVQSESLLIIPGMGVQSTVQYKSHESHLDFVPWSCIDDIVINEVITMWRVLSYLTILVKPKESSTANLKDMKLLPLFKFTKPRLRMLERMYAEIQNLLVDTQERFALGSGDRA